MKTTFTTRIPLTWCVAGCLVTAAACSDDPKASDFDTYAVWSDDSADFSAYKTFGFTDFPEDQIEDAAEYIVNNNTRIQKLVTKELEALGLTKLEYSAPDETDSGDTDSGGADAGDAGPEVPDLLVSSLAYAEDAEAWYYDCVPDIYWWGYWGGYSNCAWVDVWSIEYKVGTILIPIGDTKTETVVFVGMLQGIVDKSSDTQKRLEDGISSIFAKWPD